MASIKVRNECIIVGNASNTLNKELGNHIDSFKNVVRFNRFKINQFEKDLGKKCTHWVVGYNLITDNMAVHNGYFKENLNILRSEHPELKQIIVMTSTLTKKKDFYKIDKIRNLIDIELIYKEYKPFFKTKPTSGFVAIKYFLKKHKKITITGFDFGKSYHYWGNHSIADKPAPEGRHSWLLEKNHIDNLVKENKIEVI